jgi:hypothetical protein
MKTQKPVPGRRGISNEQVITPQDRAQVPFRDMQIQVDPYSIQHQSPQERLQFLNQVVAQVTPLMQLLQQQGVALDAQFWMKKMAEYGNSPDLSQLFRIQTPPSDAQTPSGGMGATGPKPAETTRNYVRRSIGNDTQANRNSDLMNALTKAAPNGNGKGAA